MEWLRESRNLSIRFFQSQFEVVLVLDHDWGFPWIVESAGDIDSESLLKVIEK
jgi:hypothetical protein